jgi:hypothetical protein
MNSPVLRALAWVAAAAWAVSWFLPVIDGYPGFAAFRAALEGPFKHTFPTPPEDAIPQVASALTNIALPVMLAMFLRGRVVHPGRFLRVAILCFVVNLYWWVQAARANEMKSLLAGYYVWVAAFALLVIVSGVSARQTSRTPTAGTPS